MTPHSYYGRLDQAITAALESGKYSVTEDGRILNLDFRGTGRARPVRAFQNPDGYMRVNLHDGERKVCVFLHRVVAIALVDRPGDTTEVNHKNGNKTDNRAANLEWTTRSGNAKHAYATGLDRPGGACVLRGELKPTAKLRENEVREIIHLIQEGHSLGVIAARYNVHKATIGLIATGKNWKHIDRTRRRTE